MLSGLLCTVTNFNCVKKHEGLKINTGVCHEENFVMSLFRPHWEVRRATTLLLWLDCEWYRAFKGVLKSNRIWLEQAGTKYIVPHTQSVFGRASNVCLIVCNEEDSCNRLRETLSFTLSSFLLFSHAVMRSWTAHIACCLLISGNYEGARQSDGNRNLYLHLWDGPGFLGR